MYANYNKFCKWFDLKPKQFQYNLQELAKKEYERIEGYMISKKSN